MLITVAICTFNRAESLRRTLDSLVAMRLPDDLDWEVVIVNNNCTDHTDAVIADFVDRLPICREFEKRQGQCHARNCAINVAKGNYIVWTDDDVVVDPLWLTAYGEAFHRHPEAAVFGGPIRPRYAEPAVKWVINSQSLLGSPYLIRDLGEETNPLSAVGHRLPLGANYAVRIKEQQAFRYNPALGLRPDRPLMGDEHDVIERIFQTGAVGYPVPDARVEHCIGHERQTVEYLRRYFAIAGETDAFVEQLRGQKYNGPRLFGAPRWVWGGIIEGWLLYYLYRVITPAGPAWVRHLRGAMR